MEYEVFYRTRSLCLEVKRGQTYQSKESVSQDTPIKLLLGLKMAEFHDTGNIVQTFNWRVLMAGILFLNVVSIVSLNEYDQK